MPHVSSYPDNASGVCVLTGTSNDPQGFLNLERPLDRSRLGNPACVSITYLREIAAEEGVNMRSPQEVADLKDELQNQKLMRVLAEQERDQYKAEAEALYTLAGPKLWGKAQHIRKSAGFWGRQQVRAIQAYAKDEITPEEFDEKLKTAAVEAGAQNEEELCSTAS